MAECAPVEMNDKWGDLVWVVSRIYQSLNLAHKSIHFYNKIDHHVNIQPISFLLHPPFFSRHETISDTENKK